MRRQANGLARVASAPSYVTKHTDRFRRDNQKTLGDLQQEMLSIKAYFEVRKRVRTYDGIVDIVASGLQDKNSAHGVLRETRRECQCGCLYAKLVLVLEPLRLQYVLRHL